MRIVNMTDKLIHITIYEWDNEAETHWEIESQEVAPMSVQEWPHYHDLVKDDTIIIATGKKLGALIVFAMKFALDREQQTS